MRLELSEVITCPRCGPPRVMVAVVGEARGPRVRTGFLGCPSCESRFPIEEGVLRLSHPDAAGYGDTERERAPGTSEASAAGSREEAILVAAVLGLGEGRGCVLLGPALGAIAADVAAVAAGWEVLSLVDDDPPPTPDGPENLSRVIVGGLESLPVLGGRCDAAAMAAGASPGSEERVRTFAAVLGPLGRLAVIRPGPGSEEAVRKAGLRVVSTDPRVVLAAREA